MTRGTRGTAGSAPAAPATPGTGPTSTVIERRADDARTETSTAPTGDGGPISGWGAFCQLYVLTLAGVAVAVAARFRDTLDERFRLDGIWIQATLARPDASLDPEDPFRNTAFVYRLLGLADRPDIAAMAAIALFGVGVLAAIRWSELARLTPMGLGLITVSYALALIYLAQYSKEFLSLVLVVLVLLLPRGRLAEIALVAGMITYAFTVRPYWGIVVGLYVVARVLLPRMRGLIPVFLFVLVAYVCLQLAFNAFLGESLSFSRVAVNNLRADINISVGSLIVDFLPDQVGLQWLNAFLVFLSLLVPVPLLLMGSPVYLGMAVLLTFLWAMVGWSIVQLQRERSFLRLGRHAPSAQRLLSVWTRRGPLSDRTPRPQRAVALLLALVVVQAIFEPDYGSYVKHIVPMLPLFLALLPLRERRGRKQPRYRPAERDADLSATGGQA